MLSSREKYSGFLLLLLLILKGFGDMLGVAVVFPFLKVLGDPDIVESNPTALWLFSALGFTSFDYFIFAGGVAVIGVVCLSAVLRSLAIYAINRWTSMREYTLSRRLLETYLQRPYEFFLNRHSGDLSAHILYESGRAVSEYYRPALDLISGAVTLFFVCSLLMWADPVVTILSMAVLGGVYVILYIGLRPLIRRMGESLVTANKERFKVAGEALGGVKQIKLIGREQHYVAAYTVPARKQARIRALNATIRVLPRYAIETLAFGGIVLLTLALISRTGATGGAAFVEIAPLLGLYAFAGYRMLPNLQMLYASAATMRTGTAVINALHGDFEAGASLRRPPKIAPVPLGLRDRLVFDAVSYRYPNASSGSLDRLTVEVERGSTVGIVGATGAGKTTFVDLLLGLLTPETGQIRVDGQPITHENVRAWQASLGYVPQDIFLIDASVSENIAMGVSRDQIDPERTESAARLARIHDFVIRELPNGYDTPIGERGVRLSGGQRQRIGIARALYGNPDVVVFDEATSALDNVTEREVMSEIANLSGAKTLIVIAHRLTTVRGCDKIIVLDQGRVVGLGTYDQLAEDNVHFRKLARFAS
jgi:ABC-type multidrug transport system fused ATPase/permease subunit